MFPCARIPLYLFLTHMVPHAVIPARLGVPSRSNSFQSPSFVLPGMGEAPVEPNRLGTLESGKEKGKKRWGLNRRLKSRVAQAASITRSVGGCLSLAILGHPAKRPSITLAGGVGNDGQPKTKVRNRKQNM